MLCSQNNEHDQHRKQLLPSRLLVSHIRNILPENANLTTKRRKCQTFC